MMKAEDIKAVEALLQDLDDARRQLVGFRGMTLMEVDVSVWDNDRKYTVPVAVDDDMRALILLSAERRVQDIEDKLRSLGCEPPEVAVE